MCFSRKISIQVSCQWKVVENSDWGREGIKGRGGVRRGESPNQINTVHANIVCCACLNILRLVTMWVEIVVGL